MDPYFPCFLNGVKANFLEGSAMHIQSEENAWAILAKYIDGKPVERPIFDGWPSMTISIRGEDYLASITAGQMEAYLEFQATINRAFAALAKGHFDARYLKDSEEEELTLRTQVKKGSSILETDLSPLVQALSSVVGKASPTEVIVGGVLISLALTSPLLVKYFVEGRARELELKNTAALIDTVAKKSAEETRRLGLYDNALKGISKVFPALIGLMPQLKRSQLSLLSSIDDADSATINGVLITQDQIQDLNNRRPRNSHKIDDFRASLQVMSMQKAKDHYKLKLENKHQAILAKLSIEKFSEHKIGRLISAFRKSASVDFHLRVTRADQATMKGYVEDFVVPKGI